MHVWPKAVSLGDSFVCPSPDSTLSMNTVSNKFQTFFAPAYGYTLPEIVLYKHFTFQLSKRSWD